MIKENLGNTIYDSNYEVKPVDQQPLHYARPLEHLELIKDVIVFELRRYFTTEKQEQRLLTEVPSIEKYRITDPGQNEDGYISSLNVIRQLPDVAQKLPILAVTVATGKSLSLGIGGQYVGVVQEPPQFLTSPGPWVFAENSQLLFTTKLGQSIITFTDAYVDDFNRVRPDEVANAINSQSSRIVAEIQPDSSLLIYLKTSELGFLRCLPVPLFDYRGVEPPAQDATGLLTADPFMYSGIPLGGANADAASALGLVGKMDDNSNPLRPPKHRYHTAKDLTLNIDIGADDDNQRTELTDLLCYFFDMRLQERDFTLLGDVKKGQNWQIVTKKQTTLGGESEIPRAEGDGYAKIYINRISIPLISVDYIDRPAVSAKKPEQGSISFSSDQT